MTTEYELRTNTKEDIQFELKAKEIPYAVEAYLIDSKTYSIRAYDCLHAEVAPHNDNQVMVAYLDSEGKGEDFTFEVDDDYKTLNKLEDKIADILYSKENGLIRKHWVK